MMSERTAGISGSVVVSVSNAGWNVVADAEKSAFEAEEYFNPLGDNSSVLFTSAIADAARKHSARALPGDPDC